LHRMKLLSWENLTLLIVAVLGLLAFVFLYDRVFPTASIDFEYSKGEIAERGEEYLARLGIDTAEYQRTVIFGSDDDASVYLSKQLGLEETNEIIKSEVVPVWRWELRWFIPEERTEYRLYITPQGELVSFQTILPEEMDGGDIGRENALDKALSFLSDNPRFSQGDWKLVEDSSKERPNRTDYYFTWEEQTVTYGEEGHLRMYVVVSGEEVSAAQLFFKGPEKFLDGYQTQRSWGTFLGMFALLGMVVFVIAGVVIFLRRFRGHTLPIKYALSVGAFVAIAVFLFQLNSFPTRQMAYDTSSAYATFIFQNIFFALMGGLLYGAIIFVIAAAGQSLGLKFFQKSLATTESFRRRTIFGRPLAMASLRGYLVAFIAMGFQSVFFFIATRYFGVWAPASNEYSEVYGTVLPFIAPLTVGIMAAVSEEYIFRLFAVSWLKSFLRKTFVAALLASMIWALGHSSYAIYPVYTRGIELTLFGLLFCFFFLRYDLMTVIIAHYAIDAIYVGLPMLKSGNTYFFVSGLVVMALAALPLFALLFLRRRREVKPALIVPHIPDSALRIWTRRLVATLAALSAKLSGNAGKELTGEVTGSFWEEDFGVGGEGIAKIAGQVAQFVEEVGEAKGEVVELTDVRAVITVKPREEKLAVLNTYLADAEVDGVKIHTERMDKELRIVIEKI